MFRKAEAFGYETFWRRVGAMFVDILVFLPITLPAVFIQRSTGSVSVWILCNELPNWLAMGYIIGFHKWYGQTIGKRVCKIQVLDLSGELLSWRQAILRHVYPLAANSIILLYAIFDQPTYLSSQRGGFRIGDQLEPPSWFYVLSWAGVAWLLLELFSMLFSSQRRALHDHIAGSVVVRTDFVRYLKKRAGGR